MNAAFLTLLHPLDRYKTQIIAIFEGPLTSKSNPPTLASLVKRRRRTKESKRLEILGKEKKTHKKAKSLQESKGLSGPLNRLNAILFCFTLSTEKRETKTQQRPRFSIASSTAIELSIAGATKLKHSGDFLYWVWASAITEHFGLQCQSFFCFCSWYLSITLEPHQSVCPRNPPPPAKRKTKNNNQCSYKHNMKIPPRRQKSAGT